MDIKLKKFTVLYIVLCSAIVFVFAYLMLDFFIIPKAENKTPEKILILQQSPGQTDVPVASPSVTPEQEKTPEPEQTPERSIDPTDQIAQSQTPGAEETPTEEPTATPEPTPTPTPEITPEPTVLITENEYHDGEKDIVLTVYREYNTDIYVADVKLKDVFSLKTAFAKNKFGKNIIQPTSVQAENNNAILAINGDYYGKRDNGYVVRNAEIWRKKVSARNERNTYDDLAILQDGSFRIFQENKTDMEEVAGWGAWQVFSFGPGIIVDGEIAVDVDDDVQNHLASNPRTVIAEVSPGHYLLVVSDGRTSTNAGVSLYEMAVFLKSLGATQAYNLDGGGSTTMYFNGRVVNKPVNSGRITERYVSDIVYIPY